MSSVASSNKHPRAKEGRGAFPRSAASVIPLLQQIQETEGFISEDAVERVARDTGSAVSAVYGVTTFYAQFRMKRPGRHMIRVCEGTACHVLGSGAILERLMEELGVQVGGTTADGMFTLESVRCLGCCSLAPAVMVDGETHGRLTQDSLLKILVSYREERA